MEKRKGKKKGKRKEQLQSMKIGKKKTRKGEKKKLKWERKSLFFAIYKLSVKKTVEKKHLCISFV